MGAADINTALAQRAAAEVQRAAMYEELSLRKASVAVNLLSIEGDRRGDGTATDAAVSFLAAFFDKATTQIATKEGEAEFPVLSTA